MLLSEEDLARIFQQRIDEEEAATGERSLLRDQPAPTVTPNVLDDIPGFTRQGEPDAPYYTPSKDYVPPDQTAQAPSPAQELEALAPKEPDPEAALRELIPDAFERAAQRTRAGVKGTDNQGREEGTATKLIETGVPKAYQAFNKLAKDITEQSQSAAMGDDYNAKPIVDAAQMALPGKGALLLGGGLLAAELNAKKGTPLSGTPKELADLLIPPAEAKTDQEKLIDAARKRLAPGEAPPDAAEQLRQLGQGRIGGEAPTVDNAPINAPKLPRAPKQRSKETPEQFAVRYNAYLEEKKKYYSTYTPTATRIIQSVGGPYKVDSNDTANWAAGAALISAGMILAPRVFRAFKSTVTAPPRSLKDALTLQPGVFGEQVGQGINIFGPRAVRDAAPGTMSYTTPKTLLRSADDINQVVLEQGRKVGIVPAVQGRLENTFAIYTRANSRHLVESATETGRMETPAFRFNAPMSLAEMQRTFTPQMKEYIVQLDTFEQLVERSRMAPFRPGPNNPNPGLPVIAGHTTQTLAPVIRAMEQAHPEVRDAARAWEAWNRERRRFNANGEYAVIEKSNPNANPATPNRSQGYMNAQRRYEIPWLRGEQNRGIDIAERIERQDPIQMQSRYSKIRLKERLNNEAIGQYVDAMRQAQPGTFVRLGQSEREALEILGENPHWRENVVKFYRRGKREYYTTDPTIADALKMDPYVITSQAGQIIYAAKRMVEWGSTGLGAPFFAPTSMTRNYFIGKMSADAGYRSPGVLRTIAAIPQQLGPLTARAISMSMEAGSGGKMNSFAGEAWAQSLAQRMAGHYNQSLYAQLQRVGSTRGSILEHENMSVGLNNLKRAVSEYQGPFKAWLNGYKNLMESLHNATGYAYARKNLGVDTLPQVASRARALTGDPRKTGQYYFKDTMGVNLPIRYERGGSVTHTIGDLLTRPYLVANEVIGRTATPWFNPTQQGIKRIGESYLENPAKFVMRAWMYAASPAAGLYMYTHALGNDPNGRSYVDYAMRGRGSYPTQMNFYIPIPGRPAEDGIEVPFFHELAPVKRLMEVGMDHMFRHSQNTLRDDFWKAANAFIDTAIVPPLPPVIGAPMAMFGINPPMGLPLGPFGGEAYPIKTDPFDQLGGMPANIEAFARALGGGVATTVGAGYAAYTQTPQGFIDGLTNAGKAVGRSMVQRTPYLRDVTGILSPMTGNTDTRKELFEKQREIDQLLKFYTKWGKNEGNISVKPASTGGGIAVDTGYGLGPVSAGGNPGLKPPTPTNPLYVKFMEDVYNRFKHESPNYVKGEDKGGIGFRSLWRRYGDASEALKMLRPVNDGNNVTWQKQLSTQPEVLKELQAANVDTTNIREVRNYYQYKQLDAARVILKTVRAVEEDFSNMAGRPIKLKDIQPYSKPVEENPEFFAPNVVDEVARNWQRRGADDGPYFVPTPGP